jgi:hypothetical protein
MESTLHIFLPAQPFTARATLDAPTDHDQLRQAQSARIRPIQQALNCTKSPPLYRKHSTSRTGDIVLSVQRSYFRETITLRKEVEGCTRRLAHTLGSHIWRLFPTFDRLRNSCHNSWFRLRLSKRVRLLKTFNSSQMQSLTKRIAGL